MTFILIARAVVTLILLINVAQGSRFALVALLAVLAVGVEAGAWLQRVTLDRITEAQTAGRIRDRAALNRLVQAARR
jgi:hypothetical protein